MLHPITIIMLNVFFLLKLLCLGSCFSSLDHLGVTLTEILFVTEIATECKVFIYANTLQIKTELSIKEPGKINNQIQ